MSYVFESFYKRKVRKWAIRHNITFDDRVYVHMVYLYANGLKLPKRFPHSFASLVALGGDRFFTEQAYYWCKDTLEPFGESSRDVLHWAAVHKYALNLIGVIMAIDSIKEARGYRNENEILYLIKHIPRGDVEALEKLSKSSLDVDTLVSFYTG